MVKQGVKFGHDGRYLPGDIVELTDREAGGFLDKLTPVASIVPEYDSTLVGGGEDEPGALSERIVAALEAADITPDMLPLLTDEEIIALDGIGQSSLEKIREQYPQI